MSKYAELVKAARGKIVHPQQPMSLLRLCADAIEALEERVAELEHEAEIKAMRFYTLETESDARIAELEAENTKLREALTKIKAKENYSYMRVWTGKSEPDTIARAALEKNDG